MLRILVVTPDAATRKGTVTQLERMGHLAFPVGGIGEAKKLMAEHRYDVLVLDTGLELDAGRLPAVDLTSDWEEMRRRIAEVS